MFNIIVRIKHQAGHHVGLLVKNGVPTQERAIELRDQIQTNINRLEHFTIFGFKEDTSPSDSMKYIDVAETTVGGDVIKSALFTFQIVETP